ncbi:hypothetical protein T484DRAFT_1796640 [Baffinella frigidus]|nr:hypothetical protein T484DRAFT_1796640 [Cryptophyta sp. CCMP2293]
MALEEDVYIIKEKTQNVSNAAMKIGEAINKAGASNEEAPKEEEKKDEKKDEDKK